MRQNRRCLVKLWKCQKAMSILPHEAKALLQLFCLEPIIFGWRQNSLSGAFASWGKIKIHYFTWAARTGSDWWFSKILQSRTGSDSILSEQGWTRTEKFHSPLITAARITALYINIVTCSHSLRNLQNYLRMQYKTTHYRWQNFFEH